MKYTMKVEKEMVSANGTIPVSTKHALVVARRINRYSFGKAKEIMDALIDKKISLNGKYYTAASKNILDLMKSAESNAVARDIDPMAMKIFISVHKGPTLYRGRRKREFGLRLKRTNVQIVLKPARKKAEEAKKSD